MVFCGWSTCDWDFLPSPNLSSAELFCFDQVFHQVITSQQSLKSLLSLCGKKDKGIGHSIASTALALASLSLGLLHPKEKGGHLGGQAGQNETEGQVSISYWSLADDRFQPGLPCAPVAELFHLLGGSSHLGWFDSSERMSSFGVSGAGQGGLRGQV